jgi:hypothetical protein
MARKARRNRPEASGVGALHLRLCRLLRQRDKGFGKLLGVEGARRKPIEVSRHAMPQPQAEAGPAREKELLLDDHGLLQTNDSLLFRVFAAFPR